MRLASLDRDHSLLARIKLRLIELVSRKPPADVLKLLMYRPEIFGAPFSKWLQSCMRGPSEWTVGERELFAALTSKLSECEF